MNVNALLESFGQMDLNTILDSESMLSVLASPAVLWGVIAGLVISLLWCFFGLKLVRLWAALFGLVIGAAVGAGAAAALNLNETVILIAAVVVGIILALAGSVLYHVGIFLVAWIAGSGISASIIQPRELPMVLVCAGIGLVLALLTLKFAEPITMVVTGIMGAVSAGSQIGLLFFVLRLSAGDTIDPGVITGLELRYQNVLLRIVVTVVLAVLGIMVQFLLESGKRKRQSLRKAKEIRAQSSTENEVEKARAMMGELDLIQDEVDGDDYEIYDEELDDEDDI